MTQCTSYAASTANKHKTEEIHRHKTGKVQVQNRKHEIQEQQQEKYRCKTEDTGAKQEKYRSKTGEIHLQNRVNTRVNTGAKIPNK